MLLNSFFTYISLLLLAISYQSSINPDAIKINSLSQMGTFDLGSDTSTVYGAAGFGTASKVYTLTLINARPNGYNYGLAWRNLEWDFTTSARGYIRLSMTTFTQASFSFQLGSYFAFFILRLKFSYIAIDSSIKNFFYIQLLSIPLPTNPAISPNSYMNKTLPITFPGSTQFNVTQTLLYSINYQIQVISGQRAGIFLSVIGLNETDINISVYFPYTFTTLSTIKFFVLYFIPEKFNSILSPINYYIISTGQPIGATLSYTSHIIYTNTNYCRTSDQNTFIGLESFSKSDRIKYELYLDSSTINITANYQGYRFSLFSICSLGCQNSSYPFYVLGDSKCYDECPPGTYENITQIKCYKCQNNCLTCQNSASFCLSCTIGTYYHQNVCSKTCPKLNSNFSNLVQNNITGNCDELTLKDCVQAISINNIAVCLQCNLTKNLQYDAKSRTCVCKTGYVLKNGDCVQYCGDGIIGSMQCDDGNLVNNDGCSYLCKVENNFACSPVQNGPNFISKCKYTPNINIDILSQTKIEGENTLKIILAIFPTPTYLTVNDIKKFLNAKIGNQTLNMSNLNIQYKNGVINIFIPYTKNIQNSQLELWTNFDSSLYSSMNSYISQLLKGDNVSLMFSQSWKLYQNLSTFIFILSIFVCIVGILSSYKHKMIGLELIVPYQLIFYSQSFYSINSVSNSLYSALKPFSFSIFSPNEMNSKGNPSYSIAMSENFLQNYNILGVSFLIVSLVFIYFLWKIYLISSQRFQKKVKFNVWLFENKSFIQKYKIIVWKPYFVFFSLSTFPLLFALLSPTNLSKHLVQDDFNTFSQKSSFLFAILFLFSLFYTSIPNIFYHNYHNKKKSFKNFIFKQECQIFRYDANYCIVFEIHYLIISFIIIFCDPIRDVLYSLSTINGLFLLYMLIKRPYLSKIDKIGSTLSCFIVFLFISINLCCFVMQFDNLIINVYDIFALIILSLLIVQLILTFVRLYIFWKEQDLTLQQLLQIQRKRNAKKTPYVKDEAFKKYTKQPQQDSFANQQLQFHKMMKQIKPKYHKDLVKPFIESQIQQICIPKNKHEQSKQKQKQKNQNQNQNYSTLQRVKIGLRQSYRNVYGQSKDNNNNIKN